MDLIHAANLQWRLGLGGGQCCGKLRRMCGEADVAEILGEVDCAELIARLMWRISVFRRRIGPGGYGFTVYHATARDGF